MKPIKVAMYQLSSPQRRLLFRENTEEPSWIKASHRQGRKIRPPNSKELTDPDSAYYYAIRFLKAPFPEGEAAIAQSDYYSYLYARNILKGPFKKGEAVIAKDGYCSYSYARNILLDWKPQTMAGLLGEEPEPSRDEIFELDKPTNLVTYPPPTIANYQSSKIRYEARYSL